jgi:hypothetical protein
VPRNLWRRSICFVPQAIYDEDDKNAYAHSRNVYNKSNKGAVYQYRRPFGGHHDGFAHRHFH